MSLKDYATSIGLCPSYFYNLKKQNKSKWELIKSFDNENEANAIMKYIDFIQLLLNKMENIINSFDIPSEYGKMIFKIFDCLQDSKNFYHIYYTDSKCIFQIRDSDKDFLTIKHSAIQRFTKIVKYFYKNK